MIWVSIVMLFLGVSPAFGQRDAPVWEAYLTKIAILEDNVFPQPTITVDLNFKKNGGPHEHNEHQAYILVYLKKDEEQILKLAADPELTNKKNEKTKTFLDLLVEKKLVFALATQVAKLTDTTSPEMKAKTKRSVAESFDEYTFPFKFTFTSDVLFQSVEKLGNFDIKSVDVVGSYTWFNDKFKLMVFVPVNDSAQATKVSAELHKMYDFASLMDFHTSVLYFRPLPYEFQFKKTGEPRLLIYIN
jgi:hypothetical protein